MIFILEDGTRVELSEEELEELLDPITFRIPEELLNQEKEEQNHE